ncbi:MAG: hypothetical protein PHE02_04335 [Lachnospiraceae bacterium]|nr:hypothetical protein [Lachnospiraceae bacterium]
MAFIFGRKACEKEKYQIIGFCHLRKKRGCFYTRIPERVLFRSETKIYYIRMSKAFAKEHYMEELVIEWDKGKKSVRIEGKIWLRYGFSN